MIKLLLQHKPHHVIHSGSVQVCFHLATISNKNPHGGMDMLSEIGCWHQKSPQVQVHSEGNKPNVFTF
jgi:hypothetical protein